MLVLAIVNVKTEALILKRIRESLFWSHFEQPWPGNRDFGCSKSPRSNVEAQVYNTVVSTSERKVQWYGGAFLWAQDAV